MFVLLIAVHSKQETPLEGIREWKIVENSSDKPTKPLISPEEKEQNMCIVYLEKNITVIKY